MIRNEKRTKRGSRLIVTNKGVGVLPSPYFSIISSRKRRGHPERGGEGKVGRGLPSLFSFLGKF